MVRLIEWLRSFILSQGDCPQRFGHTYNERRKEMYGIKDEQRDELAGRTDREFDNWAPEVVRKVTAELLTEDIYRVVVMRVSLTDEITATSGALTAIDKALDAIANAYQGREPKRVTQYGELQVTVWADDSALRQSLKYYAGRARREIEEQAAARKEMEVEEITASLDKGNQPD
jgi:hypothetical protein